MSGFPIIDLVAGLIFIYFLASIICSSAVEILITGNEVRSKVLGIWLRNTFDKTIVKPDGTKCSLGEAIVDHSTVTALSGRGRAPSYIYAGNFTSVLLEKITFDVDPETIPADLNGLLYAIKKTAILSTDFKRVLLIYGKEAKETYKKVSEKKASEIDLFRVKIENWYISQMDRVTGSEKRYSRPYTIVVATIITLLLNIDSIALSKYLYTDHKAVRSISAKANGTSEDDSVNAKIQALTNALPAGKNTGQLVVELKHAIETNRNRVNSANSSFYERLPFGWAGSQFTGVDNWSLFVISKIGGLCATILAIMVGAPFWFDLLNRIADLRGTEPKPSTKKNDEGKK